jgi:predicted anti-sigma-YlaC factor YlaD
MDCQKVENLMSTYIENEVSRELHKEITLHLEQCERCRHLKEKVEELLVAFPELEEDVPFFLKNRLYYIPESQEIEEINESKFYYLRWVAAIIGTFVLFLNLFYFTNIYPPANKTLHNIVSGIKSFTVETGAFIQKVTESKGMFLFSLLKQEKDSDPDSDLDKDKYNDTEKKKKKANDKGGKNGRKKTGK